MSSEYMNGDEKLDFGPNSVDLGYKNSNTLPAQYIVRVVSLCNQNNEY